MNFDLNLSTRPFKPYRGINLGLFALLLILGAISILQVYSYQHYSNLSAGLRESEGKAREEFDLLSREVQTLNAKMNSGNAAAKLSEVEFLNQLLVRKSFSWTRVFSTLERIMPDNVHLISLRPTWDEQGMVDLDMNIRGRSLGDATQFLRALEESDVFENVRLKVEEKKDISNSGEVEFILSASYRANPAEDK